MNKPMTPVSPAGSALGRPRRVCAFLNSDNEGPIMRTHPFVIVGGILQNNPFFVPPEEFLKEIRDRRGGRIAGAT